MDRLVEAVRVSFCCGLSVLIHNLLSLGVSREKAETLGL